MLDANAAADTLPQWWSMLSSDARAERTAAANKAWDLFWFVHGISFNLIDSRLFKQALAASKQCPSFVPCCRQTLAGSHLRARDADANEFKEGRLHAGKRYGFLFTSDGWKNKKRRTYHNYLLVVPSGPIFLALCDMTGESGTGVAIHDEVKTVFDSLDESVVSRIVIGCTDTPSANRVSWRLLTATYPRQVWIGCMAHELGLLFKDWVKKIEPVTALYMKCKSHTIWIRNHGDILSLYNEHVQRVFPNDKRRWGIQPYMPGDTRMATVFKLLHRASVLKMVFQSLVTDPRYVVAAQAAIGSYNSQAKPANKVAKLPDGSFPDRAADDLLDRDFWRGVDLFLKASKTSMYLLRLVDSCAPCLGKVYYTCALIGKHLAILSPQAPWVATMNKFFVKRWARWHHPIHTLSYAMDPSYQAHDLSAKEAKECKEMIAKMRPESASTVMVELNSFRSEPNNFEPAEWRAVDNHHAYQWWDTFGTVLPALQSLAVDVLSKPVSASACEFNWSLVSSIERKGRGGLQTSTTCATTNVAAMYKLEQQVRRRGVNRCLPSLDAVIERIIDEDEDEAPLGAVSYLAEAVRREQTDEEDEEDEDESQQTAEDVHVFTATEDALYADWSTRDNMLPALK